MARPLQILFHPRVGEIRADLRAGCTQTATAAKFGVSLEAITRLVAHDKKDRERGLNAPEAVRTRPVMPPPGGTPLETARASAEYARAMLEWMSNVPGVSQREVTQQQALYLNAQKLVAKLSGALDVTPGQIARHPVVRQLCAEFEAVLGDDRVKVAEFRRRLEILTNGKTEDEGP